MSPSPSPSRWFAPCPLLAGAVVRVGGAYILLGAVGKMLFGTPADLPAALLRWMYWDHHALLVLVVATEALVGVIAMIAPRLAWPIVMAALLAFMAMLGLQVSEGAVTCGCFGSVVTVPPWVMLIVDGLLLALLAWSRPWSSLAGQPWRWWSAAAGAAAAIAAGAWVQQAASVETPRQPGPIAVGGGVGTVNVTDGSAGTTAPPPPSNGSRGEAHDEPAAPAWRLPQKFPRYVVLQPDAWIGQRVEETVLATWVDPSAIPGACDIVFFMETCSHCAAHLRQLAQSPPPIPLVLIQVPTPPESTYPVVVDTYPSATRLRLPRGTTWHIRLPWHVEVRSGTITKARYLGQ